MAVDIANPEQASALITLESLGQVRRFRGWKEWTAPDVEVTSSSAIATGIDGEGAKLLALAYGRHVPPNLSSGRFAGI